MQEQLADVFSVKGESSRTWIDTSSPGHPSSVSQVVPQLQNHLCGMPSRSQTFRHYLPPLRSELLHVRRRLGTGKDTLLCQQDVEACSAYLSQGLSLKKKGLPLAPSSPMREAALCSEFQWQTSSLLCMLLAGLLLG